MQIMNHGLMPTDCVNYVAPFNNYWKLVWLKTIRIVTSNLPLLIAQVFVRIKSCSGVYGICFMVHLPRRQLVGAAGKIRALRRRWTR